MVENFKVSADVGFHYVHSHKEMEVNSLRGKACPFDE